MTALFENGVLTLRFQMASLSELVEMRRTAAQHGACVHDLYISMGSMPNTDRAWFAFHDGLKYVDYQPINWDALLLHLPNLRSLNLSEMPHSSPHVWMIVEAAGERCTELETVVLPTLGSQLDYANDVESMMKTLCGAMKKWCARVAKSSLRKLTVACLLGMRSRGELVQRVLTNYPNLTRLKVVLRHVENDDPDPSAASISELLKPNDVVFGDDEVKWCPPLRCFTVRNNHKSDSFKSLIDRIRTITDRSLVVLSKLSYLSDVQLNNVSVTGDGLFELLSSLAQDSNNTRTFEIAHCCNETKFDMKLFHTFMNLMLRIARSESAKLLFASANFVLKVRNASPSISCAGWSDEDTSRAKLLVDRVKAKHPSLRIRVIMSKYGGAHACNFGLYTDRSTLEPGNEWDSDDPDRDNSFVIHKGWRRCEVERKPSQRSARGAGT